MIIAGDETILQAVLSKKEPFTIFNLSNALSVGIRLPHLIPPVFATDSREFDMFYANYIFGENIEAFKEFISIVVQVYYGANAYILIDHDEYRDAITESIAKLIQQRYGYNIFIVNDAEDLEYVSESEFSIGGLYNLDIDKEKYTYLTADPKVLLKDVEKEGERYDTVI